MVEKMARLYRETLLSEKEITDVNSEIEDAYISGYNACVSADEYDYNAELIAKLCLENEKLSRAFPTWKEISKNEYPKEEGIYIVAFSDDSYKLIKMKKTQCSDLEIVNPDINYGDIIAWQKVNFFKG